MDTQDRPTDHTASFVVRVWWDRTGDRPVWRGWIQHAVSGEGRYVHTVKEAARFVERHTCTLGDTLSESSNDHRDAQSTKYAGANKQRRTQE